MQNFSDRLKSAIKSSGKRKGALALYCGVEASTVTRWLNGTQPMTDSILRMAEFLGVDAKWLMVGDASVENAESSGNPKECGIGESAHVLRDQTPIYRARGPGKGTSDGDRPPLQDDPVAAAFAKIREGLDLLEQLMKNMPQ